MRSHQKTSVEDAEQLISEFFKSGKSRKSFCDEHGIKVGTFHWWMKRHKDSLKMARKIEFSQKPFIQITPKVAPVNNFCDIITSTTFWLEPIYKLKKSILLKSTYLQVDETPIPVLTKQNNGKTHKGFYWVYYDPVHKNVIFEYRSGRGREGPNIFLKDFIGILQVDGYTGYDELASKMHITRAACMAHVRRKFEAALDFDKQTSEYALNMIRRWFDIEQDAKKYNLTYDQRRDMRCDIMKRNLLHLRTGCLKRRPTISQRVLHVKP